MCSANAFSQPFKNVFTTFQFPSLTACFYIQQQQQQQQQQRYSYLMNRKKEPKWIEI